MITIKNKNWQLEHVEAVFFDKDGTLIDSHVYWGKIIEIRSAALVAALDPQNKELYSELCRVMGWSLREKRLSPSGPIALVQRDVVIEIVMKYLLKSGFSISEQEIGGIFTDVHKGFIGNMLPYIKIIAGVEPMLMRLKKRGVKLAVITTDAQNNTLEILQYLDIDKYFDLVVTKESTKESKPGGMPALFALKSLKVKAENSICIGDAPMDILMGENARLKATIGVATGQITLEELMKYTKYFINNLSEVEIL